MKLIRQDTLYFQEGRSDKVYEVDLCEVGPDQFVVNFRYGRRGGTLRDGSKTPAAVPRAEAEKIYERLIHEKRSKGYRGAEEPAPTPSPAPATADVAQDSRLRDLRAAVVLERLRNAAAPSRWKLSRVVWRAGDLRLGEAEPLLISLLGSGDAMLDYCIARSLALCGGASAAEALRKLQQEKGRPYWVRRMAAEAYLQCLDEAARDKAIAAYIRQLPEPLAQLAEKGPSEDFEAALYEFLDRTDRSGFAVLDLLYLIDSEIVRPALLHLLMAAPLAPNYFRRLRHIFKSAELRNDAEVFGILAHRFETSRSGFSNRSSDYWWELRDGRYRRREQPPTHGPDASMAFGKETRDYLRRRIWWALQRLGELGDDNYVRMAVGVLLPFRDDDAQQPRRHDRYDWSTYRQDRQLRTISTWYDRYANYWALNQILYGNSPRYTPYPRRSFFRCVDPFEPGGQAPDQREEAFPQLWAAQPQALLHLLDDSRCEIVHQFAVRVLRDCPDFVAGWDNDVLRMLLRAPYAATLQFALDVAVTRYDAANPDLPLVAALANCDFEAARKQARRWIDAQRERFFADSDFTLELLFSRHPATRRLASEGLRLVAWPESQGQALLGRIFARLHDLGSEQGEIAGDVADAVLRAFAGPLRTIGADVIRDLLRHPLPEVRQLAGELVLQHENLAQHPPEDVLRDLLAADSADVRAVGVRIIGQLPDDVLKRSVALLTAMTRHPFPDIRENIRGAVIRLAAGDAPFGRRMAAALIDGLLEPGAPEGVPGHTARVLCDDLKDCLDEIPAETVWRLVRSRSGPAQEVGGLLLPTRIDPATLSAPQLVQVSFDPQGRATVNADAGFDTMFMRLFKVNDLTVNAVGESQRNGRSVAVGVALDVTARWRGRSWSIFARLPTRCSTSCSTAMRPATMSRSAWYRSVRVSISARVAPAGCRCRRRRACRGRAASAHGWGYWVSTIRRRPAASFPRLRMTNMSARMFSTRISALPARRH